MSYRETSNTYKRSRSPLEQAERRIRKRSRSPHSHHHHASSHRHRQPKPSAPIGLPLGASPLSKNGFEAYKPMFGLYLDIQKHLVLEELSKDEVRGRWKSFVGKWNRGELAEGWYDPATLQKAQASAASNDAAPAKKTRLSPTYDRVEEADESSDEDVVGPALPGNKLLPHQVGKRPGPAIPNLQDLELQRDLELEDFLLQRQDLRRDRRRGRKDQNQKVDDLVPRAEAGTKERMLEKKREKADSNRAFASGKTEAGGVDDVPESDLLGDEDGGIEGFKKQKKEMERKKNEREVRKDEILRARREEREERIREYKAKEERTMSGLVALAKAKFG